MPRIVVTGIGAVTPLGNAFSESWEAAKTGQSGLRPVSKFNASSLKWKIAGELYGFDAGPFFSEKEMLRLDPFVQYAVAASIMAAEDAGLVQRLPEETGSISLQPEQTDYVATGGVVIGSSRGGISTMERELHRMQHAKTAMQRSRLSPYLMPSSTISMASSTAAQKLGIRGHCLGISNACASGTNAIGEAFRLLKAGFRGPVLAGGSEAPLCRICIEGYGTAGALSKKTDASASRPFDINRDGFVLSEGACIMVLEHYESARHRGARMYGEIAGYGNTSDAYHMTRPDPSGEAAAIQEALGEAKMLPDEIEYVNTHGTATKLGDRSEALALKKVFGKRGSVIPASAAKSATGHLLAASGALEAAFALMTLKEGIIPPTINIAQQDPDCDLNIITEKKHADITTAISNSFGFGGVNAVLVLKRL